MQKNRKALFLSLSVFHSHKTFNTLLPRVDPDLTRQRKQTTKQNTTLCQSAGLSTHIDLGSVLFVTPAIRSPLRLAFL